MSLLGHSCMSANRKWASFAGTLLSVAAVACWAGTAAAAGGTSISNAAPVQIGVVQYGNTASGTTTLPFNIGCEVTAALQVWKVNLIAGDQVTVSGGENAPASGMTIEFFPANTTDADLTDGQIPTVNFSGSTANDGYGGGTLGQLMIFTVPSTGSYPFVVGSCSAAGPYHFELEVKHADILYAVKSLTTPRKGVITVYARTPDGNPVSSAGLVARVYGLWRDNPVVPASEHSVGRASVIGGEARVDFDLPPVTAHKTVGFIVEAYGSNYQTSNQLSVSVRVL
jgi:hypothetical protein